MTNVQMGHSGLPIVLLSKGDYEQWFAQQSEFTCNWLVHSGFKCPGYALIPGPAGNPESVVVVTDDVNSCWSLAEVAIKLPAAQYFFDGDNEQQASAALGWLLAQYSFDRYRSAAEELPTLVFASEAMVYKATKLAEGVCLTRDMVNTPAGDMMPENISAEMQKLAAEYGAQFSEIVGDELLAQNYPTVHMVGRASIHSPRLLDMSWGETNHPKLTLVGKGVCFDSGGLDMKSPAGMRLMKKDMGGAAHVLGLASLIMAFELPVRLRVIVPAVENAVSNNAFHPGDIVTTRKGLTVEIDNTDAEGRLVLCDALAEADAEAPDLIIDFATLTGAARIALGLEVPGFYSTDDKFSQQMLTGGDLREDAVWQLPLHQGYADYVKGSISDLINCPPTSFGGSIVAALYLQQFVENTPWVHIDVGAWNDRARPGRPKGGEAMGIRAVFDALETRYSK